MAKPTSAFFRAGPSFVPSPVTATTCRWSPMVLSMMPEGQTRAVRACLLFPPRPRHQAVPALLSSCLPCWQFYPTTQGSHTGSWGALWAPSRCSSDTAGRPQEAITWWEKQRLSWGGTVPPALTRWAGWLSPLSPQPHAPPSAKWGRLRPPRPVPSAAGTRDVTTSQHNVVAGVRLTGGPAVGYTPRTSPLRAEVRGPMAMPAPPPCLPFPTPGSSPGASPFTSVCLSVGDERARTRSLGQILSSFSCSTCEHQTAQGQAGSNGHRESPTSPHSEPPGPLALGPGCQWAASGVRPQGQGQHW